MATKYNSYGSAVSDIIKYKKWGDEADASGDETAKNNHADSAAPAYEWLRNNGYGDAANTLQASNYTDAKKWATNGKTQTRPYLYSLGQKYGLSNSDVDKIITYDNGNVFIGGKNIGSPDLVVDGVSYWGDTSTLDKELSDYISRSGTTVKTGVDNPAYNQSMKSATDKNNVLAGYIDSDRKDVQGKYNNIYDYANQDITKTDEYKSTYNSIMGKYDLSALQGRDNAAASGAASNGGNIDSYAAANAMRQQAALTATGQQIAHQAGLDAYNARVSNVANILNNLGVYNSGTYDAMNQTINNDRNIANDYFNNAETAKNNEAARQQVYSDISGTVGDKVTKYLNSNVWNDDGSLKNYNKDFQASIDDLEKTLNATTDPTERARITEQLRVLEMARNQKIDEQGLTYGKTYKYQTPTPTQASKEFDKTMDYNNKALEIGSADTRYGIDAEVATNKYNTDASVQMNTDNNQSQKDTNQYASLDKKEIDELLKVTTTPSQDLIDAYNLKSGDSTQYTVDNPPPITGTEVKGNKSSVSGNGNSSAVATTWENDGIQYQSIKMSAIDDSEVESSGVDQFGLKAINSALSAVANGQLGYNGYVSNYDLADYLITHSNENDTDKKQLKKVFAYFGLDATMLDNVEDVGKGKNMPGSDYKYGVQYVK